MRHAVGWTLATAGWAATLAVVPPALVFAAGLRAALAPAHTAGRFFDGDR